MTNRAPRRALRELAHLGEGNMYFKIKKLNLCLRWSVDTWTPRAISSVALQEIDPYGLRGEEALLVSGLKQDKYGAKARQVWRKILFVPSKSVRSCIQLTLSPMSPGSRRLVE